MQIRLFHKFFTIVTKVSQFLRFIVLNGRKIKHSFVELIFAELIITFFLIIENKESQHFNFGSICLCFTGLFETGANKYEAII